MEQRQLVLKCQRPTVSANVLHAQSCANNGLTGRSWAGEGRLVLCLESFDGQAANSSQHADISPITPATYLTAGLDVRPLHTLCAR